MWKIITYPLLSCAVACGGLASSDVVGKPAQPAGSAGAGGMPSAGGAGGTVAEPPTQVEVVDDVDHLGGPYPAVPAGSSAFFWRKGLGNWFVSFSDGSGGHDASIDQIIPSRGESSKAYHVIGPAPGVAVDLWAQLDHRQGRGVDLSAYSGISFWARGNNPNAKLTVAFGVDGKFFDARSGPPWAQKGLPISKDWAQFTVMFDGLDLKVNAVSSIDFIGTSDVEPIDLWVDDLAFLCRSGCP